MSMYPFTRMITITSHPHHIPSHPKPCHPMPSETVVRGYGRKETNSPNQISKSKSSRSRYNGYIAKLQHPNYRMKYVGQLKVLERYSKTERRKKGNGQSRISTSKSPFCHGQRRKFFRCTLFPHEVVFLQAPLFPRVFPLVPLSPFIQPGGSHLVTGKIPTQNSMRLNPLSKGFIFFQTTRCDRNDDRLRIDPHTAYTIQFFTIHVFWTARKRLYPTKANPGNGKREASES